MLRLIIEIFWFLKSFYFNYSIKKNRIKYQVINIFLEINYHLKDKYNFMHKKAYLLLINYLLK